MMLTISVGVGDMKLKIDKRTVYHALLLNIASSTAVLYYRPWPPFCLLFGGAKRRFKKIAAAIELTAETFFFLPFDHPKSDKEIMDAQLIPDFN